MKLEINSITFSNDNDEYLDVDVDHCDGYLTLRSEPTGEFVIKSVNELDQIYNKLKELLNEIDNGKKTN